MIAEDYNDTKISKCYSIFALFWLFWSHKWTPVRNKIFWFWKSILKQMQC